MSESTKSSVKRKRAVDGDGVSAVKGKKSKKIASPVESEAAQSSPEPEPATEPVGNAQEEKEVAKTFKDLVCFSYTSSVTSSYKFLGHHRCALRRL